MSTLLLFVIIGGHLQTELLDFSEVNGYLVPVSLEKRVHNKANYCDCCSFVTTSISEILCFESMNACSIKQLSGKIFLKTTL